MMMYGSNWNQLLEILYKKTALVATGKCDKQNIVFQTRYIEEKIYNSK